MVDNKTDKRDTAFKKFMRENKSMAVMLPIFILLILVLLYIYVFSGMVGPKKQVSAPQTTNPPVVTQKPSVTIPPVNGDEQSNPETSENTLNLLPIRERALSDSEAVIDPFASPYKLKGVAYSEKGVSCCVIAANGKSYLLEENQNISDLLTVIKIEKETVTIKNNNGNNIVLSIFE